MQKLLLFLFLLAGIASSCNNAATTSGEAAKDTASTSPVVMNYPYTIEHPDYWEMGNSANTLAALNALKAWEEGKIDESVKYFGDSVQVRFDGIDKKLSTDSLKAFFTAGSNLYKNVKLHVADWESVISKDKKEEWVTVWYKQIWDTPKGGKDSIDIVNDLKLKDGKIVRLDEYTRKFH